MNKSRKIIRTIVFAPIISFLIFWVGSIIHTEMLTHRHGYIFERLHYECPRVHNAVGYIESLKVLSFSETTARVYFVIVENTGRMGGAEIGDRIGGSILAFSNEDGQWVLAEMERAVWSRTGSADGFVWPFIR